MVSRKNDRYGQYHPVSYRPKVMFHRGNKKENINSRLIVSLSSAVSEIREKLTSILDRVETQFKGYETKLESPFVPKEKSQLAVIGILEQIDSLEMRIKDCERLEELCR